MKRFTNTGVAIALLCFAGFTNAQLSAYGAAAKVNGVEISNESLERNFEEYKRDRGVNIAAIRYPARVSMMRQEVLDQLIAQELVWQRAQESEFVAGDQEVDESMQQVRAQFESEKEFSNRLRTEGYTPESYRRHLMQMATSRKYLDNVSATVSVDENEIHTFYVENPDKFQIPESVRARHILLKVAPQASQDKKRMAREKMERLLADLENGADFAAIAIEHSEDTSASKGGDLGYFPHANMVKSFADAAFALQPEELSGIVESVYGLHVIKVEDRKAAQTVPEEQATDQIEAFLLGMKRQQAVETEISGLRASANIEVLIPL